MTPFDTYTKYLAFKNHFTKDSSNFKEKCSYHKCKEYKYLNEQYKYDCIECYKDIDAYQIYMSKYL